MSTFCNAKDETLSSVLELDLFVFKHWYLCSNKCVATKDGSSYKTCESFDFGVIFHESTFKILNFK
jgi:hypothetical protein